MHFFIVIRTNAVYVVPVTVYLQHWMHATVIKHQQERQQKRLTYVCLEMHSWITRIKFLPSFTNSSIQQQFDLIEIDLTRFDLHLTAELFTA